jgi:hypothetical protein
MGDAAHLNHGGVACYIQRRLAMLATGFLSVAFVAAGMNIISGEFPNKCAMSIAVTAIWGLFVSYVHGGVSWRGVEDFMFLVVYGAIPAVLLFDEVVPGGPVLTVDVSVAAPVYGIISAHLIVGISMRIWGKYFSA